MAYSVRIENVINPVFKYINDQMLISDFPNLIFPYKKKNKDEKWIEIFFSSDLTSEQEIQLQTFVEDSCSLSIKSEFQRNSEMFELVSDNKKKWMQFSRRIRFRERFVGIPTVTILNPVFDGSADLVIIKITEDYFDFRIKAKNRKGTFSYVEFDWEAYYG